MPKIYLSPAYHKWNPCAISGCDETTHNNLYLDELEVYLKANNIDYKRGVRRTPKSNESGTEIMIDAVTESNAYKPDIHYISHTNASNGTVRGYRPIIYPFNNAEGEKLANIIIKYRKEIYDQPIHLKKQSDLYELSKTTAVSYYEEHVFHDNKEDATWFHNNMRKIAEQTCKGFCEYFNIPFVDPYVKNEETKVQTIYKVRKSWEDTKSQVGAYKILQNAIVKAQNTQLNVYDSEGNAIWVYVDNDISIEEPNTNKTNTKNDNNLTPINANPNDKIGSIAELIKKLFKIICEWFGKQ